MSLCLTIHTTVVRVFTNIGTQSILFLVNSFFIVKIFLYYWPSIIRPLLNGSQSLLHIGALSVRLSQEFLVLMAVCSVKSSCVLYLVVESIVVLSQAILCPVVREWWAGAD